MSKKVFVTNDEILTKDNMTEYTPSQSFHPSTKKYVDDKVTQALVGGDVDLSNYLEKDNITEYTPSTDYHPATKKYVDDINAILVGGTTIVKCHSTEKTPVGTTVKFIELISPYEGDKYSFYTNGNGSVEPRSVYVGEELGVGYQDCLIESFLIEINDDGQTQYGSDTYMNYDENWYAVFEVTTEGEIPAIKSDITSITGSRTRVNCNIGDKVPTGDFVTLIEYKCGVSLDGYPTVSCINPSNGNTSSISYGEISSDVHGHTISTIQATDYNFNEIYQDTVDEDRYLVFEVANHGSIPSIEVKLQENINTQVLSTAGTHTIKCFVGNVVPSGDNITDIVFKNLVIDGETVSGNMYYDNNDMSFNISGDSIIDDSGKLITKLGNIGVYDENCYAVLEVTVAAQDSGLEEKITSLEAELENNKVISEKTTELTLPTVYETTWSANKILYIYVAEQLDSDFMAQFIIDYKGSSYDDFFGHSTVTNKKEILPNFNSSPYLSNIKEGDIFTLEFIGEGDTKIYVEEIMVSTVLLENFAKKSEVDMMKQWVQQPYIYAPNGRPYLITVSDDGVLSATPT